MLKFGMGFAILLSTASIAAAPNVLHYKVDPVGSNVTAKVSYLGLARKTATFPDLSGDLSFSPSQLADINLNVVIDARTLQGGDGWINDTLKGEDFFDVTRFPQITYHGTSLVMKDSLHGSVQGQLTAHGITKPIALDVTFSAPLKNLSSNANIALMGKTSINRTDFGMSSYNGLVGKRVNITINTQLVAG